MSKRQKNLFHLRKILSNGFGGKTEMRPGANFVLPFPRTEGYAQELPLINKSYILFLSNLWFVCVCVCVSVCACVCDFIEVYLLHEKWHMSCTI